MKHYLPISLALFSCLHISACSDDSPSTTAAVPANAITIDSSNADALVLLAYALGTALLESADNLTATNDTALCDSGSGTVTATGSETSSSYNATLSYNNCLSNGVTINSGTVNINGTFNSSTGAYTDNASGSATATSALGAFSINNFSFNETGNSQSGAYSTNTFSFSYAPAAGGFSVNLQAPIAGDDDLFCPNNPASGTVLVTGANNTQARAKIESQMVTIEVNTGSGFAAVPNSPFACNIFF